MPGNITNFIESTFASLKHKNFRIFWSGQCISLLGTWMQRTALVWLVYTTTNSPFLVGLVGVAQFLPMLFFTLFTGAVVDRFPKRKILIVTQSFLMIQALALSILAASDSSRYWQLLLLCAFLGITNTIDMPARLSFFFELVGKDDIMNAISLNSSIVNLARIIGPAVAGIIMVNFGAPMCFFINALSFLAVIFSLTKLKIKDTVQISNNNRNLLSEIKDGIYFIKNDETLMINAIFLSILCTFTMNTEVILPVFVKTVLNMGTGAYTKLLSAAGVGSLAGAVTMAAVAKRGVKKGLLLISAAATITIQIFMLFSSNYKLSLILVASIGYCNLVFLNVGNSMFQIYAPDKYRGRVMSVYSFLTQGSIPIGNFFAGSAMELLGGRAGFPVCGIAALICLVPVVKRKKTLIRMWLKSEL
ncbi:MAG TPA: MFS transporter [Synergistaceae bacterium]|nr:MFS transporter [Synergistaceae bacterium]